LVADLMTKSTRNTLIMGAIGIGAVFVIRRLMKPADPVAGIFTDSYQGPLSGAAMPGMRRGQLPAYC
jgi:hypothetical protein